MRINTRARVVENFNYPEHWSPQYAVHHPVTLTQRQKSATLFG